MALDMMGYDREWMAQRAVHAASHNESKRARYLSTRRISIQTRSERQLHVRLPVNLNATVRSVLKKSGSHQGSEPDPSNTTNRRQYRTIEVPSPLHLGEAESHSSNRLGGSGRISDTCGTDDQIVSDKAYLIRKERV